jgi:hypothetical protein
MAKRGTLADKVSRIINGERVVVSTEEYYAIIDVFNADDDLYDSFGQYLISIPNPCRVGTKDQFLAYLKK